MEYLRRASIGVAVVLAVLLIGRGYWVAIEKPREVKLVLNAGCKIIQKATNPLSADDAYFMLLNLARAAWLNGNYQELAVASAALTTGPAGANEKEHARTVLLNFCSKKK